MRYSIVFFLLALLFLPNLVWAQDITSGLAPLEEIKDSFSRLWREFFLIPVAQAQTTDLLTGLIGHWKFDESSGTTAADSSGNNNTGTLINGPTWTTGKIGGSLTFAGGEGSISNGQYINIPYTSSFNLANTGGTLSAWIKESSWQFQGNNSTIFRRPSHGNPAADGNWALQTIQGGPTDPHYIGLVFGSENNTQICKGVTIIPMDQWMHVTASWDSPNIYLYVNGALDAVCAKTKTVTYTADLPVWIGRHAGAQWERYFAGVIDDARIYNRALTIADIQALYALGGSPPPPPTGGDTTAPTVTITAPSAGTTVLDTVTMSANAADNVAVTRVEFYVDNVLKSTDTASPYSFSWDTTNGGTHPCNGAHTHTLQARAYDAAANQGTSANVVVNMNNPSYCTTPPPPVNPASFTTPYDTIPNFAQNPTITSAQNGNWSQSATWNPARLPTASDIVLISHTVTYDSTTGDVDTIGIAAGGIFRFSTTQNTSLRVGNFLVQPNGTLEVGTQSNLIPANLTAEIVIKNKALNLTIDPGQYGTGILSIDGNVSMHGSVKTPTFVRTSVEPRAGNTTVTLESSPSGWRVGDRIFLPDTRQKVESDFFNPNFVWQVEERTINAISADGRTITLSSALTYDHRGARDADGTPTIYDGIKYLPHVGNLTRNIVIRSENSNGTRGHTLFTRRSNIDIRYVQFQDMGRTKAEPLQATTNHIGRYPLHMHQLWGPINPSNTGYQFELVGNAVNDSLKWPIAVHGSHYGLIQQNVVFGGSRLTGAGIAIEDGSETENLFEENLVSYIRGNSGPRDSGPSTVDGSTPGNAAECIWSAGFNNRFVKNVVAGCHNARQEIVSGPGFKFITHPAIYSARNPLYRGADMTDTSQTISIQVQKQPLLEFRGNEVYGIAADAITLWNLGTSGYENYVMPESVIKDLRAWHMYEAAVWNYPVNHITIDNLVFRTDPNVYYCCSPGNRPNGIQSGDYRNIDFTIRGGSIHASDVFSGSSAMLGIINIENVNAVTYNHAFSFDSSYTPGTGAGTPDPPGVTVNMRNNKISAWSGQPLRTIEINLRTGQNAQPNAKFEVYSYDYQGQIGNNFRVYFHEQATQNVAGGLAPCADTTTHPEIDGITCPISGGTPPPTTLLGDLNNDRTVNNFDWNIMTGVWFTNDPVADINKDSVVNTADYYFIYTNWGRTI